ncbi:Muskelin N-terminus-domain-containing protein [Cokeromyces recurvatus]|uniref:Muskelin N-terminus-domain-containing protein n=1 Tax=Cokeromyces recurvatus TaxID=90255 RepID=UPI00221EC4F5|nr:Muskelin N-terminus-domain-containing protein [Cokeromyces recurvatus]KAI7900702.1 Muskelin N-terminus-domain-containing protein [Cokeromyces recurvatus]
MVSIQQHNRLSTSQLASTVIPNTPLSIIIAESKQIKLAYIIHDYSSYSGVYFPYNILDNEPTDQTSRWSSAVHNYEQYIIVKFEEPVIAKTILFGKFHKGHVCNLKEFRIYGGMEPNSICTELLHDGLKNNAEPETFPLKYQHNNLVFPIKYLKIVPLSAFGPNFNYSIWYIEIQGIRDEFIIQRTCSEYENFIEIETTRLCLKYLRQKNMMDAFHIVKARTNIELEDPMITALHRHLVIETNYKAAEKVVLHAYKQNNMFEHYAKESEYKPKWRKLNPTSTNCNELPSARGGHQMCIDIKDKKIYLFGGWNGTQDLSDFWYYDIRQNQWHLISMNTENQGGPSPRSCHKICFDSVSKSIYVLGRYVESEDITDQELHSDFYQYHIENDKWIKIHDNTANEGGPELLFDHQMCIDTEKQILYVFGGRIVTKNPNSLNYGGLYAYSLELNRWLTLRDDDREVNNHNNSLNQTGLPKSRIGHSMLFDQVNGQLYIFAGQREREYLTDLYRYSTHDNTTTEIIQDFYKSTGSALGFTQRATLDEDLQEIYVLSGYTRNATHDLIRYEFSVYSIQQNEWKKLYQKESHHGERMDYDSLIEPCPRFAHQMVYDSLTKRHYIFGGNPGGENHPSQRLDDFWELRLIKDNPISILRKSLFMIRMQKLKELCNYVVTSDTLAALDYLRNYIVPVVNEDDVSDLKEFRQMCTNLCLLEAMIEDNDEDIKDIFMKSQDMLHAERTKLFEKLLIYIPQQMKEPLGKLTDVIKLI